MEKAQKGELNPIPQDDSLSCYAPMLTKELSLIDFHKPAWEVHNLVRGLSSWPAAHTVYGGKRLKVYESRLAEGKGAPGELLDEKHFVVACGDGAIQFASVQYEGGKRMKGEDFLRGRHLKKGEILGE